MSNADIDRVKDYEDTRPGEMTMAEAESIARALKKGRIAANDSRVTLVFQWIAGIGGALTVVLLTWIASNMVQMREDIAVIKAESVPKNAQLDRVESQMSQIKGDISNVDRRLTIMEARSK